MLNRDVLKSILVKDGDMYANDALQTICSKIVCSDNSRCMTLLQKQLDNQKDKNDENYQEMTQEEIKELDKLCKANDFMIKIFNQIVNHGEHFAIEFILNNYYLIRPIKKD